MTALCCLFRSSEFHTWLVALKLIDNRVSSSGRTSWWSLLTASVKSAVLAIELLPVSGVQWAGSVVVECAPFGIVVGAVASASEQGRCETPAVLQALWDSTVLSILRLHLFRRWLNHTLLRAKRGGYTRSTFARSTPTWSTLTISTFHEIYHYKL